MKRILCVVMTVVFLLSSVIVAPATADDATSLGNGFTNVIFSNEYRGFCLDRYKSGAYIGDVFTPTDTSKATNNINNGDISQKLKIFFTQCFDDLFVYDGISNYSLKDNVGGTPTDSLIQQIIYHFVGEQDYIWGMQKTLVERVNSYTGTEIPDNGYILTLSSGDTVTFYFLVMQSNKDNQQDFFAYKIVTNEKPTHKCEFPEQWESDEDSHWHECECGDKADEAPHDHSEDWESDENNHWHECKNCDAIKDEAAHEMSGYDCTVCDYSRNHDCTIDGHVYGNYVYNNDATTEADGTETRTCSVCNETETRTAEGTKLPPEEPEEPAADELKLIENGEAVGLTEQIDQIKKQAEAEKEARMKECRAKQDKLTEIYQAGRALEAEERELKASLSELENQAKRFESFDITRIKLSPEIRTRVLKYLDFCQKKPLIFAIGASLAVVLLAVILLIILL